MEEKSHTTRKIALIIILLTVIFWIGFERKKKRQIQKQAAVNSQNVDQKASAPSSNSDADIQTGSENPSPVTAPETGSSPDSNIKLVDPIAPIDRAPERVTKKKFGQYVTSQNSPVQPEKFSGFHTGTDFEIFSAEETADVAIKAVCDGRILSKRAASGYGGVLVQSCDLDGEPVTVAYGHLKLASIVKNVNDSIARGEKVGILGRGYSVETDGERKHLHLGIHKGTGVNILGYVQNQAGLSTWLDPCAYFCK